MTIFQDSHHFSRTLGDVWWQSLKTALFLKEPFAAAFGKNPESINQSSLWFQISLKTCHWQKHCHLSFNITSPWIQKKGQLRAYIHSPSPSKFSNADSHQKFKSAKIWNLFASQCLFASKLIHACKGILYKLALEVWFVVVPEPRGITITLPLPTGISIWLPPPIGMTILLPLPTGTATSFWLETGTITTLPLPTLTGTVFSLPTEVSTFLPLLPLELST